MRNFVRVVGNVEWLQRHNVEPRTGWEYQESMKVQMLHCTDLALCQVHQPETIPMFARFYCKLPVRKTSVSVLYSQTTISQIKHGAYRSRIYSFGGISSDRQRPLTQLTGWLLHWHSPCLTHRIVLWSDPINRIDYLNASS